MTTSNDNSTPAVSIAATSGVEGAVNAMSGLSLGSSNEATSDTFLYDLSMPVFERILRGIGRYRKKRKWNSPQYAQLFTVYMRFGQVNIGDKPFGKKDVDNEPDYSPDESSDEEDEKDLQYLSDDSTEILERNKRPSKSGSKSNNQKSLEKAEQDSLYALQGSEEDLDIDFVGCTRQFLSTYMLRDSYFYSPTAFEDAPQVVTNFLTWMKQFNVCPEYNGDLNESLRVCRWAAEELPKCKQALMAFPGRFNSVCAAKYGGRLYDTYGASQELADEWTDTNMQYIFGLTKEQVELLTDRAFGEVFHVEECIRTMKVARAEKYDPNHPFIDENPRILIPHGRIWLYEHDMKGHRPGEPWAETKESVLAKANEAMARNEGLICLYVDPVIADSMLPGMVFTAEFHLLSNGIWYIDSVMSLWPSYYLDDVQEISDSDSDV